MNDKERAEYRRLVKEYDEALVMLAIEEHDLLLSDTDTNRRSVDIAVDLMTTAKMLLDAHVATLGLPEVKDR
jgi:hypothetical protein